MKRILSIVLMVIMFFNLGIGSYAMKGNDSFKIVSERQPAQPIGFCRLYEDDYRPIGNLSLEEQKRIIEETSGICEECLPTRHFSIIPHSHVITAITSTYEGQRDRGIVAQTYSRVNTSTHLTYERSRSVSNSWSASIEFAKGPVTAGVGYDCEYSTSATASYTLDIPANKLGSIRLYDIYDVTTFNCKTTYYYPTTPIIETYEYGTGWSEQWTHFGFGSSIW